MALVRIQATAADEIGHSFDPCFTTEREGGDSGPGLAVARGVFVHHGGALSDESDPRPRTVFCLVLTRASARPPR